MSEDLYVACWEKSAGPAWEARHGLTAADYQSTFNTLVGKGYRLKCVSGYELNGQARYAAIWDQSKGPAWEAHHGLTAAQYQTTFNELLAKGYRLELVSGYGVGGQALYAGIWEQSPGPAWEGSHGLDATTYKNTFDQLQSQGYRLRWVSGYVVNGTDYYAAIWDKSPGGPWQARNRMSASDYVNESDSFAKQGYRPVCVSGYSFGGNDYYAALWEHPSGVPTVSHAGMPSSTYQTVFNQMQAQGYHPYCVAGYEAVQPLEILIPFEVQPQPESEWCWAATSTSIAHFYTPSSKVTQCEVVNQQLGRTDCCVNPGSNNCNQPGFLDQALQFVGHFDSDEGHSSYQDAVGALNSGRPPCIRIGWAGGGGHFIGVNACQPNDLLSVTDPIYGDSIVAYQTFTSGKYEGSGTWTDTYFTKP
jgi:hypothetical protein